MRSIIPFRHQIETKWTDDDTTAFSYGSEIRQFHEIRISGSLSPSPDPSVESYTLGQFPLRTNYSPKYGSGSELASKAGLRVEASLGGEGAEGGRYLVQKWGGGTICDKTGLPRSVEVQVRAFLSRSRLSCRVSLLIICRAFQFHCNTASTDRIAVIRETAICQYVLLLHTPRLCSEPVFIEGREDSTEPASIIECRPVVDKIIPVVDASSSALGVDSTILLPTLSLPVIDALPETVREEESEEWPEGAAEEESEGAAEEEWEERPERAAEEEHAHTIEFDSDFLPGENLIMITYDAETGAMQNAMTEDGTSIFDDDGNVNPLLVQNEEEGGEAVTPERLTRLAKMVCSPFHLFLSLFQ